LSLLRRPFIATRSACHITFVLHTKNMTVLAVRACELIATRGLRVTLHYFLDLAFMKHR
jgi:hypothetical protein